MSTKDLNERQRKVLTACRNGWFMSGTYRALFDEHERRFEADSPTILYRAVDEWYSAHEENHADSHLLVKCEMAA